MRTRANPKILVYNPLGPTVPHPYPDCPDECELIFDRQALPECDIVVLNIARIEDCVGIQRYPGQTWVAWSLESDVNYPLMKDPAFMSLFDVTMTYRRDADVWFPYFDASLPDRLLSPPKEKTEDSVAVYFNSHPIDRSGRTEYVRELMRCLQVDSYGAILRNRWLPKDEGRSAKLNVIARYRFTLALENSCSRDYVTEKFFESLIAGSVPVYLGAPNVDDFAPADRCFINVADFRGPHDLACYLQALCEDRSRYDEYLAWKSNGLREQFVAMAEQQRVHPFSRLARKWQDSRYRESGGRSDLPLRMKV